MPKSAIPKESRTITFVLETPWQQYATANQQVIVNDPSHAVRWTTIPWSTRATAGSQPAGFDFWMGKNGGTGANAPAYRQGVCYKTRITREIMIVPAQQITNNTSATATVVVSPPVGFISLPSTNLDPGVTPATPHITMQFSGARDYLISNPFQSNRISFTREYEIKHWAETSSVRDLFTAAILNNDNSVAYRCPFTAAAGPSFLVNDALYMYDPYTNAFITSYAPGTVLHRCRLEFDCVLDKLDDEPFIDS